MKLSNLATSSTHKVLIQGLPKTGKSTLAVQLSEKYRLIWIDTERGRDTLLKLSPAQQANVEYFNLPDSGSFPIAAESITKLFKNKKWNICNKHGRDQCMTCKKDSPDEFSSLDLAQLTPNDIVVLDSITQVSHSILANVMKGREIDSKPERDDWGALRKFTEWLCSEWQAANYNLICISHTIEANLEDGKTRLVPSFGSAAMSAEISKAFDTVVYCDIKNGKHIAASGSLYSNQILTSSRTDFKIEELKVPSLIPYFDGSYVAKAAATPAQLSMANLQKLTGAK